ncbi:hypothetical protein BDD12DRAFT_856369 [Trichophaea hybrida]|nr:hypothetical protein BDD12DRAFT_856369 [Trichophaea hybrida]
MTCTWAILLAIITKTRSSASKLLRLGIVLNFTGPEEGRTLEISLPLNVLRDFHSEETGAGSNTFGFPHVLGGRESGF